jgi:hypothetical protein
LVAGATSLLASLKQEMPIPIECQLIVPVVWLSQIVYCVAGMLGFHCVVKPRILTVKL